jgi:hypothetical protein
MSTIRDPQPAVVDMKLHGDKHKKKITCSQMSAKEMSEKLSRDIRLNAERLSTYGEKLKEAQAEYQELFI